MVYSDTQSNVWEVSIPSGWLMQHLLASRNTLLLCCWKRCCISFLVELRLSVVVVVWFVVGRPFSSSFISCPHKIIVCPFCWWHFDFIIPSKFAIYYFFSSFFLLFFFVFLLNWFLFSISPFNQNFVFFFLNLIIILLIVFFLQFFSINFSFQFWFLFF